MSHWSRHLAHCRRAVREAVGATFDVRPSDRRRIEAARLALRDDGALISDGNEGPGEWCRCRACTDPWGFDVEPVSANDDGERWSFGVAM